MHEREGGSPMSTEKGILDSWITFISIVLACLLLAILFGQTVPRASDDKAPIYMAQSGVKK